MDVPMHKQLKLDFLPFFFVFDSSCVSLFWQLMCCFSTRSVDFTHSRAVDGSRTGDARVAQHCAFLPYKGACLLEALKCLVLPEVHQSPSHTSISGECCRFRK